MNELAELRRLCNHRPFEWIVINGRRAARCVCGIEMFVPLLNEVCWTCGTYREDGCACGSLTHGLKK